MTKYAAARRSVTEAAGARGVERQPGKPEDRQRPEHLDRPRLGALPAEALNASQQEEDVREQGDVQGEQGDLPGLGRAPGGPNVPEQAEACQEEAPGRDPVEKGRPPELPVQQEQDDEEQDRARGLNQQCEPCCLVH